MSWQNEYEDVQLTEPIQPKKDCLVQIAAAEGASWTVKPASEGGAPGFEGQVFPAMKLTVLITDPNVETEHEGSRVRRTIEHRLNLDRYPFKDKNGAVGWMGKQGLYELEEALGFPPVYVNAELQPVEPFITRTGRKAAPRGEGIKRQLNQDFLRAYFTPEGNPNLEWAGKNLAADIEIQRDDRYGDRNRIVRFKPVPVNV